MHSYGQSFFSVLANFTLLIWRHLFKKKNYGTWNASQFGVTFPFLLTIHPIVFPFSSFSFKYLDFEIIEGIKGRNRKKSDRCNNRELTSYFILFCFVSTFCSLSFHLPFLFANVQYSLIFFFPVTCIMKAGSIFLVLLPGTTLHTVLEF